MIQIASNPSKINGGFHRGFFQYASDISHLESRVSWEIVNMSHLQYFSPPPQTIYNSPETWNRFLCHVMAYIDKFCPFQNSSRWSREKMLTLASINICFPVDTPRDAIVCQGWARSNHSVPHDKRMMQCEFSVKNSVLQIKQFKKNRLNILKPCFLINVMNFCIWTVPTYNLFEVSLRATLLDAIYYILLYSVSHVSPTMLYHVYTCVLCQGELA